MTPRRIRIETCEECPHRRGIFGETSRCAAVAEDYHGVAVARRFRPDDNYPEIPDWCPLEIDTDEASE